MRRSEQEITNRAEIEEIISKAQVCRIALSENDTPYIIPVCFGCEGDALYFHSAKMGRKLDILRTRKVAPSATMTHRKSSLA